MEEEYQFCKKVTTERVDSDFFMLLSEEIDYDDPLENHGKWNLIPSFTPNQSVLVSNKGFTKRCDWLKFRNVQSMDVWNMRPSGLIREESIPDMVDLTFERVPAKHTKNALCQYDSNLDKAPVIRCVSSPTNQVLKKYPSNNPSSTIVSSATRVSVIPNAK
jgi:hypothetical protein